MPTLGGLDHQLRPAAGEPEGALVLLHGRGSDEYDLLPVLDALDPRRRLVGVTPRGPLSLPPGGAHWYAPHRIGFPAPATFWPTFERLTTWLDGLAREIGVSLSRTVLGGFSQGAVMSYAAGMFAKRPRPAGILAMSGFVPTVEGLELKPPPGLPVTIVHGAGDGMIGVEWGRRARDELTAAGADVSYAEHPGGHHVDPRQIPALAAWVAACTASTAAVPPSDLPDSD